MLLDYAYQVRKWSVLWFAELQHCSYVRYYSLSLEYLIFKTFRGLPLLLILLSIPLYSPLFSIWIVSGLDIAQNTLNITCWNQNMNLTFKICRALSRLLSLIIKCNKIRASTVATNRLKTDVKTITETSCMLNTPEWTMSGIPST
jgi:hypothetical protein